MASHITEHNWCASVDAVLENVLDTASSYPKDSVEAQALIAEAGQLRRMREAAHEGGLETRQPFTSPLIAIATHEGLTFSSELIEKVGVVYNVYRRWRRELT